MRRSRETRGGKKRSTGADAEVIVANDLAVLEHDLLLIDIDHGGDDRIRSTNLIEDLYVCIKKRGRIRRGRGRGGGIGRGGIRGGSDKRRTEKKLTTADSTSRSGEQKPLMTAAECSK